MHETLKQRLNRLRQTISPADPPLQIQVVLVRPDGVKTDGPRFMVGRTLPAAPTEQMGSGGVR
jgi:hypothetical protein